MARSLLLILLLLASCLFVAMAAEQSKCVYDIEIKTSCGHFWKGYGTDGEVSLMVADGWDMGPSGNYAYFSSLDNPGNDFENCNLDKYTRGDQPCVNFCSMKLSLRASSGQIGTDWHVDYVKVSTTNATREFPVNAWLRTKTAAGNFEVNQCG